MGKKTNKSLSKCIELQRQLAPHVDLQIIQQLYKDEQGDEERIRQTLAFLSQDVISIKPPSSPDSPKSCPVAIAPVETASNCLSTPSTRKSASSSAPHDRGEISTLKLASISTDSSSETKGSMSPEESIRFDKIDSKHGPEFELFSDIMRGCLSSDQIFDIWSIVIANIYDRRQISESESLLSSAIETAFRYIESNEFADESSLSLFDSDTLMQSYLCDEQSTQEVALSFLLDQFEARENSSFASMIRRTLEECRYDIDEASLRICDIASTGYLERIDQDFPSLEDGVAISKIIGDKPLPSMTTFKSISQLDINQGSKIKITADTKAIKKPWKPQIIVASSTDMIQSKKSKGSYFDEYNRWRNVAADERNQMASKFVEAAASYHRRKGLSGHLSDVGYRHRDLMNIANLRAAVCALNAHNDPLFFDCDEAGNIQLIEIQRHDSPSNPWTLKVDLHNLTVVEGIHAFNSVKTKINATSQYSSIDLIVGQGRHSRKQVSVLGPNLLKYLRHEGFACSDDGRGMIQVRWKR